MATFVSIHVRHIEIHEDEIRALFPYDPERLFATVGQQQIELPTVEKSFFGVASGLLATMRSTGMMFSMGITMVIFALHIGRVEITPQCYPQFLKSVKVIFTIFTVLSFGGIFASLARGRGGRH